MRPAGVWAAPRRYEGVKAEIANTKHTLETALREEVYAKLP